MPTQPANVYLFPEVLRDSELYAAHLFNLGIKKIVAGMREKGISITLPNTLESQQKNHRDFIKNTYDIIGFSTHIPNFPDIDNFKNIIQAICRTSKAFHNRNPNGLVVLGGYGSHYYTHMFLMNSPANIIVRGVYGEAVDTMIDLSEKYNAKIVENEKITSGGHDLLKTIKGIAYKYKEKMYETEDRIPPRRMPVIRRELEEDDVIIVNDTEEKTYAHMDLQIIRAGCDFSLGKKCSYCSMGAELDKIRSGPRGKEVIKWLTDKKEGMDIAIEETAYFIHAVKKLNKNLAANKKKAINRIFISLADDNMNHRTLKTFIDRIDQKTGSTPSELRVSFMIRPENISPALLKYLETSLKKGLEIDIKLGIEFASKKDLKFANRHYDIQSALSETKQLDAIGIDVRTFHILTTPETKAADFQQNLDIANQAIKNGKSSAMHMIFKHGYSFPDLDTLKMKFIANNHKWEFYGSLRPTISDDDLDELIHMVMTKRNDPNYKPTRGHLSILLKNLLIEKALRIKTSIGQLKTDTTAKKESSTNKTQKQLNKKIKGLMEEWAVFPDYIKKEVNALLN